MPTQTITTGGFSDMLNVCVLVIFSMVRRDYDELIRPTSRKSSCCEASFRRLIISTCGTAEL